LSKGEVGAYVNHRLAVAGTTRKIFPDSTIDKLFRLSKGIPRMINVICDRALLGAYVRETLVDDARW
jgi:general secretion pathway protein A